MQHTLRQTAPRPTAEILDFDEALLQKCTAELRAELMTEATMLAKVFAPAGEPDDLLEMARVLSSGERDGEMARARARKLAAALRHLARNPWAA